jgi:PmbA protein
VSDNTSERTLFSTAGLAAYSRSRSFTTHAYALAEKGDANAMEGKGQFARQFKQLDKDLLVKQVYADCIAMLEGKPVASKRYDVIFDQESQSSLFGVFSAAFSGKWAKDGINPWRDSLGKVVADERLQVFDSPLLQDGSSYTTFDAEGSQTQRTVLINDGVLQTLLHNSVTARFYGVENTANAVRGAKSELAVSMHQREVSAGDTNITTLRAGEFIEITGLSGLHSGANAISGDFSLGASGYLCRDGERLQAVRGITVAGNFYTMLNDIAAIGDTQHWNWSKSVLMPAIRFNALAISG